MFLKAITHFALITTCLLFGVNVAVAQIIQGQPADTDELATTIVKKIRKDNKLFPLIQPHAPTENDSGDAMREKRVDAAIDINRAGDVPGLDPSTKIGKSIDKRRESVQKVTDEDTDKQFQRAIRDGTATAICGKNDQTCAKTAQSLVSSNNPQPGITRPECDLANIKVSEIPDKTLITRLNLSVGSGYFNFATPTGLPDPRANPMNVIADPWRAVFVKFINDCFSNTLSKRESEVIGILIHSNPAQPGPEVLLGMATLVNESTLVTAMHVVYDEPNTNGERHPLNPNEIIFIPARDSKLRIKLFDLPKWRDPESGLLSPIPNILHRAPEQNNDIVWLALAKKIKIDVAYPTVSLATLDASSIRIPAINLAYFQISRSATARSGNLSWTGWEKYATTDQKGACRVLLQRDNGCVIHGCSTLPGMSGAGVFVEPSDEALPLKLIAVHGGELRQDPPICASADYTLPSTNVATRVSYANP